jgi:DNA-binding NarL/FixJ family response regulator
MLRILVADDHGIVRSGLKMLIDRHEGMNVVAEAGDGVDAVAAAQRSRPDVAILDVAMPRMTGIQAAREIRAHCPDTAVLLLSMHDDERYVHDALRAGAAGYVLKRQADAELIEAVHSVAAGGRFISSLPGLDLDADHASDPLTPRELDVVKLIAEAYTNRQIAATLSVSEKTVESHRANVLSKLGMRDRVELVRYAIKRGLVEP